MSLRILSLLPAATEMVYLLGLDRYLVGLSDDCDFPPQVKRIPRVTSSSISNAMTSLEIDMAVKKLGHRGNGVFHIDQKLLRKLNPNLILTQELCEVCAVGFNQVKKAARILDSEVKIISLEPQSIEDILENIRIVGEFGGKGKEAVKVVRELRGRLDVVKRKIATVRHNVGPRNDKKPKVLVLEWLDPVMVAGHWVPEMVEKAGGEMVITKLGERSRPLTLRELRDFGGVDILVFAPCGFDIDRTRKEEGLIRRVLREIGEIRGEVSLVDGNSYMTRPGPRIVDGIEILAEILHPEVFPRKHSKKDWQPFVILSD